MGTNVNALVALPNDAPRTNLADGAPPSVTTGTPVYETAVRREARSYTVNNATTGDRDIYSVPAFTPENCTIFFAFKTKQAFTSALNAEYYLMTLSDGGIAGEGLRIILNYADASGFNGIEIEMQNTGITRLTIPDLNLEDESAHSLAVVLKTDAALGERTLAIYLDGVFLRGTTYTAANLPTDADALVVGNSSIGVPVAAAQCVIEDVLLYKTALDGDAIWSLHTAGLDADCVDSYDTYQSSNTLAGYYRADTPDSMVVLWADSTNNRLYGIDKADTDLLQYSDDDGDTWTAAYDFGTAGVIRSVWTWNNQVYVGYGSAIYRSELDPYSFSSVLSLAGAGSAVFRWCFAISPDNTTLAVCEYESQPTSNSNRVLTTTTGNGGEWTVRKTITGSEEHWHAVDYDSNGNLWATVGDTESRVYMSEDHGATWTTIIDAGGTLSEEQVISMVEVTDGRLLFASDSTTGRSLVRVYDPNNEHGWDYADTKWSRLIPISGDLLSNVYAIYRATNGTVWIYGHREGTAGRHSSIWAMPESGRAPVLIEDLDEDTTITTPHEFVEHNDWVYLDQYRFPADAAFGRPERLLPSRIKPPTYGTLIHEFTFDGSSGDDWAQDNTAGIVRTFGPDGMRITPSGATFPSTFFNIAESGWAGGNFDLTNCCAELEFSLDDSDTSTNRVTQLTMRWNDGTAGGTLASEVIWNIGQGKRTGRVVLPISGHTLKDAAASNNAVDDVAKLWITPVYTSNYTGSITFHALRFYEPKDTKGRVLIRLDDTRANKEPGVNQESHLVHAQTANDYGVPCCFSAPIDLVLAGSTETVSLADLKAIKALPVGHEILNHLVRIAGATSGTDGGWVTTSGSPTGIDLKKANSAEAKLLLQQNGFLRFPDVVAVPGGYEGDDDIEIVNDGIAELLWYTVGGGVQDPEVIYPWPLHRDAVKELSTNALWDLATPATSTAGIIANIDAAIASKGLFVAHFHEMSLAQFETVCAYIQTKVNAGELEVVRMSDLVSPAMVGAWGSTRRRIARF